MLSVVTNQGFKVYFDKSAAERIANMLQADDPEGSYEVKTLEPGRYVVLDLEAYASALEDGEDVKDSDFFI